MITVGYVKSHLEALARDLSARIEAPVHVGDPEGTRAWGTKAAIILRHPDDGREMLDFGPVTDHRPETEPFVEVTETLDLITAAPDYAAAMALLLRVELDGIQGATQDRNGLKWLSGLGLGSTRRPRANEALPQGVPVGYFVLVSVLKVVWLASRQNAIYGQAEGLEVNVQMKNNSGETVGETTILEATP